MDLLDVMREGDPCDVEHLSDVNFLRHQLDTTEQAFASRFSKLSTGLCDVLDNYGLLNFTPLAIENAVSVRELVEIIDRANGFKYSGLQGRNPYCAAVDTNG
jgi:GPN-loop GTPase